MAERKEIRLLRADEIECRVGNISEKGLSLLLYKDARVDQKILDETFGRFGWRRSHQSIGGSLYCTVEIYNQDSGEWIGKQDVGSMGRSEQEKEKTMASDSFKRACVNWGIGRELYSAPFIWIPSSKAKIEERNGKCVCYERFIVADIQYDEGREIRSLVIADGRGQRVYEWQSEKPGRKNAQPGTGRVTARQIDSYNRELERTGVTEEAVAERFQVGKAEEMSPELYGKVMKALRATKARVA